MSLDPQRLVTRFWNRTQKGKPHECWPWLGGLTAQGYGYFFDFKKQILAHRFAYELANGPIPSGKQIHHLCGLKPCMNPAHLTILWVADHTETHRSEITAAMRAGAKARTHCKHGHEYTPQNTHIDKHGHRHCRACAREWYHAHHQPVRLEKRKRFKEHCPHGHSYPENARYKADGAKYCGECSRLRANAYYHHSHPNAGRRPLASLTIVAKRAAACCVAGT